MTPANNEPQASQAGNFAIGQVSESIVQNTGTMAGIINNVYGDSNKSCFFELNEEDLTTEIEFPYREEIYLENIEKLKEESLSILTSGQSHILLLDREIGDPTSLNYAYLEIAKSLHQQNFKIFCIHRNKENLSNINYEISRTAQQNPKSKLLFILDDITNVEFFSSIQPDILFPRIESFPNIFLLITSRDNVENWGESIQKYRSPVYRISPSSILPQNINQFYGTELSYREKLLCIGLTFFDGLPEDQFFAALEDVVARSWQKRDPSLKALDYCDIQNLYRKYFGFSIEPYHIQYKTPLKVVNPQVYRLDIYSIGVSDSDLRLALLRSAWKRDSEHSLRRQITSAISVLVSLVIESTSIQNTIFKWELYGSEERQQNLRRVIAKALCDLGQVSADAVEAVQSALVQLGNHDDDRVREVAAQAASGWYASEEYRFKFFRALENFYSLSFMLEKQHEREQEQASSENKKYYVNSLGATVALCIKHAVKYDPHNNLNSILVDWLQELSQFDNPEIQRCFRYQTLPVATAFHLNQLYTNKFLQEILNRDINFAIAIAQGIAQSFYKGQSDVALDLLNTWHQNYLREYRSLKFDFGNWSEPNLKTSKTTGESETPTDTTPPCKLVVVNLARAFFDYNILGEDVLSFKSSAQIVLQAFTLKARKNIRDFMLVSALLLFNCNIEKFKKYLEDLLSELSVSRREVPVQLALDIYHDDKVAETVNRILRNQSSQEKQQLQDACEFLGLAQILRLPDPQVFGLTKEHSMEILISKTFSLIEESSKIFHKDSKLRKSVVLAFQIAALGNLSDFIKGFESSRWTELNSDKVIEFFSLIFLEIYLNQRSSLAQDSASSIIKYDTCEYPIWKNNKRPLTAIETCMLNWIQNSEEIRLKKLGLQCFIRFAEIEQLF